MITGRIKDKLKITFAILALAAGCLISCKQFDDLDGRLDRVETELAELKSLVMKLQDALDKGKIIQSASRLPEGGGDDGWVLTFTDGTEIKVLDGKDGENGKDSPIAGISENKAGHTVTITLTDGTEFTFRLAFEIPTSIAILNTKPLVMTPEGEARLKFAVNPSSAEFGTKDVALNMIGETGSITVPEKYELAGIEKDQDIYIATIRERGKPVGYNETCTLVIKVTDIAGKETTISSDAFEIRSAFQFSIDTGLAAVIIDTPGGNAVTSKEDWMEGASISIISKDMVMDCQGTMSIKGRGNDSWGLPKKSYNIKLEKKSSVLGMPKHKRWCLLANWRDRTLMRNAVTFHIAKQTGLAWTPSGEFVELILNGKHMGNYYLCEQIKVDENRVNISDEGFLFELDSYYDEQFKFRSMWRDLPWEFKDPDEVTQEQFNEGLNFVKEMEGSLYEYDRFIVRDFVNYMDLGSFADFWIVNELVGNPEIRWPKSTYMYLDKGGKMTAGPVWDFDWGPFTPGLEYKVRHYLYYDRMFRDSGFVDTVKQRWRSYYDKFREVPSYMDEVKATLTESERINTEMWPVDSGVNGDERLSFDAAVERMKEAYSERLEWLNAEINGM